MLSFIILQIFAGFYSSMANKAKKLNFLINFQIFDRIWHVIEKKPAKTHKNEKMQHLISNTELHISNVYSPPLNHWV